MALRQNYAFIALSLMGYILYCSSTEQKEKKRQKTIQNFAALSPTQKVQYFYAVDSPPLNPAEEELWLKNLQTQDTLLLQAVLSAWERFPHEKARTHILQVIRTKKGITRYHALKALARLPTHPADLPMVALALADQEWLARAQAIRMVRNYPQEKKQQKYYYKLLVKLQEHNPDVVQELYRTLRWYARASTFSFLYKRSFHARTDAELIFILRELNHYPHRLVDIRLQQLKKYHKSFLVRHTARKLLQTR